MGFAIVFALISAVAFYGTVILMYMLYYGAIGAGYVLLGIWVLLREFVNYVKARSAESAVPHDP